jgi:hypothetical protein
MGKHHEDNPERRGGLRWKGDTTDGIPVIPEWQGHEGITDHSVDAFVAAIHSTNPPGMEIAPEHARYAWMIERCSNRDVAGDPVRRNAWVQVACGYTAASYSGTAEAAQTMLDMWFLWNGVTRTEIRSLHTMWVRHATEASWTERLDGR